jgi:hypothetical protein
MANIDSRSDNSTVPSAVVAANPSQPCSKESEKSSFVNNRVSRGSFLSRNQVKNILEEHNFNRILEIIKLKMLTANQSNNTMIKIQNSELTNFQPTMVDNVKEFLMGLDYKITDIEDPNGILTGWSISWNSTNRKDSTYSEDNAKNMAINFFQSPITKANFPNKNGLKMIMREYNFNNVLEHVRLKMVDANNSNQTSVKIHNSNLSPANEDIIEDVKTFLRTNDYVITDTEDPTGAIIGWRLSWK